jgi:hypothetical protein
MADNPGPRDDPASNPQFKAIMDAIDAFSQSAAINPLTPTTFVKDGAINTKMRRQLVELEKMLSSFCRQSEK